MASPILHGAKPSVTASAGFISRRVDEMADGLRAGLQHFEGIGIEPLAGLNGRALDAGQEAVCGKWRWVLRGEERERFPAVCVRRLKYLLLALLPAVQFKHLFEPEPWASGAVEAREAAGRRLLSPCEKGPKRGGGAESAERAAQWRLLGARSQEAWGHPWLGTVVANPNEAVTSAVTRYPITKTGFRRLSLSV